MASQLLLFLCFFAAVSWEKDTKNGAAVTSLRHFLFRDEFNYDVFATLIHVTTYFLIWFKKKLYLTRKNWVQRANRYRLLYIIWHSDKLVDHQKKIIETPKCQKITNMNKVVINLNSNIFSHHKHLKNFAIYRLRE